MNLTLPRLIALQCAGLVLAVFAPVAFLLGASHYTSIMLAAFGVMITFFFFGVIIGREFAAPEGGAE